MYVSIQRGSKSSGGFEGSKWGCWVVETFWGFEWIIYQVSIQGTRQLFRAVLVYDGIPSFHELEAKRRASGHGGPVAKLNESLINNIDI